MPRGSPKKIDRPVALEVSLPTSVRARLDLYLFSEIEGRVPKGAYQRFFLERLEEFFGGRRLDLTPFNLPQGFYVVGPSVMIEALERRLKDEQV